MLVTKDRMPCCAIEDKYIDALLEKNCPTLSLDLAVLLLITRFEKIPKISELSKILHRTEIEIECSFINLSKIGFLSFS